MGPLKSSKGMRPPCSSRGDTTPWGHYANHIGHNVSVLFPRAARQIPQIGWPETTDFFQLPFLEGRSLKSGCLLRQAVLLLLCQLVGPGVPWCRCIAPVFRLHVECLCLSARGLQLTPTPGMLDQGPTLVSSF